MGCALPDSVEIREKLIPEGRKIGKIRLRLNSRWQQAPKLKVFKSQ